MLTYILMEIVWCCIRMLKIYCTAKNQIKKNKYQFALKMNLVTSWTAYQTLTFEIKIFIVRYFIYCKHIQKRYLFWKWSKIVTVICFSFIFTEIIILENLKIIKNKTVCNNYYLILENNWHTLDVFLKSIFTKHLIKLQILL